MENCGNALSLYQIHSQGANLIVTNVVTIMTDLSLFVSYRGMVVDPQHCGILCNTPSSVNSGMHSICTVFGGCILPSLIYVIFITLLIEIKYVVVI